jgi:hypothetical protein
VALGVLGAYVVSTPWSRRLMRFVDVPLGTLHVRSSRHSPRPYEQGRWSIPAVSRPTLDSERAFSLPGPLHEFKGARCVRAETLKPTGDGFRWAPRLRRCRPIGYRMVSGFAAISEDPVVRGQCPVMPGEVRIAPNHRP